MKHTADVGDKGGGGGGSDGGSGGEERWPGVGGERE